MKTLNSKSFAATLLKEGIVIERMWHLNRFPGKYSVDYKGQYYTIFLDRGGNPHHSENRVERTPALDKYEN
jgi:hypothetical protein